jgi:hypothetical protein
MVHRISVSLHLRAGLEGFSADWTRNLAWFYSSHWCFLRRWGSQCVRLMRLLVTHDLLLPLHKLDQTFLNICDCSETITKSLLLKDLKWPLNAGLIVCSRQTIFPLGLGCPRVKFPARNEAHALNASPANGDVSRTYPVFPRFWSSQPTRNLKS